MIMSRLSQAGGAVAKQKRDDVAVKIDADLVRIAKLPLAAATRRTKLLPRITLRRQARRIKPPAQSRIMRWNPARGGGWSVKKESGAAASATAPQ